MSVETDAVAGIGFDIFTDKDIYDIEELEEKYNKLESGYIAEYGSYWSGKTCVCLLATDPVNGVDKFIEEMKLNGFPKLEKSKLKFISEILEY